MVFNSCVFDGSVIMSQWFMAAAVVICRKKHLVCHHLFNSTLLRFADSLVVPSSCPCSNYFFKVFLLLLSMRCLRLDTEDKNVQMAVGQKPCRTTVNTQKLLNQKIIVGWPNPFPENDTQTRKDLKNPRKQ